MYRKTKPLNTHLKQNNIMKKFNLLVLCLFATFLAFPKGNAGGKTDGKKKKVNQKLK